MQVSSVKYIGIRSEAWITVLDAVIDGGDESGFCSHSPSSLFVGEAGDSGR